MIWSWLKQHLWFNPQVWPMHIRNSPLGLRTLLVALEEQGYGETTGNNVTKYSETPGPWCAAFLCCCIKQAAAERRQPVPFELSHGARKLYRNIGRAGEYVEEPVAGDVVAWKRGRSWHGHVGIIEHVDNSGLVHTVEGNVGKYPAVVRRLIHDPKHEPHLIGFARMP